MIIFFPTKIRPTGGSSTFALKLQRGLRAKKHAVTFKFTPRFDILLVNAQCPLRYLLYAKLRRRPIVHRLDGVYYPMSVARFKYFFYNLPLQIILHFFASAVVFQSRYSQSCAAIFLGTNRYIPNHQIYNGVDTAVFSPRGPARSCRQLPDQSVFITASRFRRPDQILPLLDAFLLYQQQYHAKARLIVIGDFSPSISKLLVPYKTNPSILFLGAVPNNELPAYCRAADLFLFTHLNPPCPNNIIEAMACGLPICGVADGAMPEITMPGVNSELIPVTGSGFFHARSLDLSLFTANIQKIMQHRRRYAAQSRLLASERFSLRPMIDRYLEVFTQVLQTEEHNSIHHQ